MILQLLLSLAVLHLTNADACPASSACLYFASCEDKLHKTTKVSVETNDAVSEAWLELNCEASRDTLQLSVLPITDDNWNFTLRYTNPQLGVRFGDLLVMKMKEPAAVFNDDTKEADADNKIPYHKDKSTLAFAINKKNLLASFHDSKIFYFDGTNETNYTVHKFWKRFGHCEPAQIIDFCEEENCTKMLKTEKSVTCPADQSIWLMSDKPAPWIKLTSITCNDDKDWTLIDESKKVYLVTEDLPTIQCSDKEPKSPASPTTKSPVTPSRVTVSAPTTPNFGTSLLPTFLFPILLFVLRI